MGRKHFLLVSIPDAAGLCCLNRLEMGTVFFFHYCFAVLHFFDSDLIFEERIKILKVLFGFLQLSKVLEIKPFFEKILCLYGFIFNGKIHPKTQNPSLSSRSECSLSSAHLNKEVST